MVSSSSSPPEKKTSPRKSKTLLIRLFLWLKKFLDERKLPYVANQACRVYFGKEKASRRKCQSILQTRIELDVQQLRHFLQTAIGDRLLAWLSPLFHFPDHPDSKDGLRQLFLEMAGDQKGISFLQLLHLVPEQTQINLETLMARATQLESLVQKTEKLLKKVRAIADANVQETTMANFANLPDLQQRGSHEVLVNELTDEHETLYVQPTALTENTRIIVLSHGLGAQPQDLLDFGEHFASHGYFVVIPHHAGSSGDHLKLMLQGEVDEVFPYAEFGDRPRRISELLNWLMLHNYEKFGGKLNVQNVGIMGHSFGAYTALAVAGAKINFDHLELACGDTSAADPNISLLLQCQALGIRENFQQHQSPHDPRISCICVWDFVGSAIFGEQGLASVNLPVMAIAGSHDMTTPFALEQLRLFQWLRSPETYLVVMEGKAHVQNLRQLTKKMGLKISVSSPRKSQSQQSQFATKIQALGLAFFNQYLHQQPNAETYLTASYGQYLTRSPHKISLLNSQDKLALVDIA